MRDYRIYKFMGYNVSLSMPGKKLQHRHESLESCQRSLNKYSAMRKVAAIDFAVDNLPKEQYLIIGTFNRKKEIMGLWTV
jgi:hypothetical protein